MVSAELSLNYHEEPDWSRERCAEAENNAEQLMNFDSYPPTAIATTAERVALARQTHRSVSLALGVVLGVVAAVVLAAGIPLSMSGRASLVGVLVVAACFVAVALLMVRSISRTLRDAERILAADGTTCFVVGEHALTVGTTAVPYERITCVYAHVADEEYSSGGLAGEAMAHRVGLTDDRPTLGRAVGAAIGARQRRKLYRDGAKSTISLMIGVDRKADLCKPKGLVNDLKTLPMRGDDPGRIDIPFGAYFGTGELETLLGALHRATGGTAFPIAIVAGSLNWAQARTAPCETRDTIWEQSASLTGEA